MISKIFLSACILLSLGTSSVSVYEYSVPLIEGGTQPLSSYQGKKLLVITLPVTRGAYSDSLLYSLDTLASAHISDLKMIAVPAYEEGYTAGEKAALQSWYRSKLGSHIIVTDGLFTRKISGSQQHELFRWLTHSELNGRFDMDINDEETKFFTNTDGKIYGIFRSQTKIWSKTFNKVITTPVQTEE